MERTTRFSVGEVNAVLRELAHGADPASVMRECRIDMGSLTEPDGGDEDEAADAPTLWDRALQRLMQVGYTSPDAAFEVLLTFLDPSADRVGRRGSLADILSPAAITRLLIAVLWLGRLEPHAIGSDGMDGCRPNLLEQVVDGVA